MRLLTLMILLLMVAQPMTLILAPSTRASAATQYSSLTYSMQAPYKYVYHSSYSDGSGVTITTTSQPTLTLSLDNNYVGPYYSGNGLQCSASPCATVQVAFSSTYVESDPTGYCPGGVPIPGGTYSLTSSGSYTLTLSLAAVLFSTQSNTPTNVVLLSYGTASNVVESMQGSNAQCFSGDTYWNTKFIPNFIASCFTPSYEFVMTNTACSQFPIAGGSNPISAGSAAASNGITSVSGTAQLTLVSSKAATSSTSTSVSCAPQVLQIGSSSSCTATVTGTGNPTGGVGWSASGGGVLSSSACSLSSGMCSVTYTAKSAGNWTITASYGGDSANGASSNTTRITTELIQCPWPNFAVQLVGVRIQGSVVSNYLSVVNNTDTIIVDGKFYQVGTTPITPNNACGYSLDVRVTLTVAGADGIPYQYNGPVLSSVGTQPIPDTPTTWLTLLNPPTPRVLGMWHVTARADVELSNVDNRTNLYGFNKLGPYYSPSLSFVVRSNTPTATIVAALPVPPGPGFVNLATYGNITGNVAASLGVTPGNGLVTLAFNLQGQTNTYGYTTMIIPKALIAGLGSDLSPSIIVNGTRFPFGYPNNCLPLSNVRAPSQGKCIAATFMQDATNFYIRLFIHFSTEAVEVDFAPHSLSTGQSASLVLGQASFSTSAPAASQNGLSNPKGMAFDGAGDLWLVDRGNNRILEFKPPFGNQMAAVVVLGQPSFTSKSASASQTGLSGPYSVAFDGSGDLWVADALNNRVLEFKPPFLTGMAASLVVGQSNFTSSSYSTTQQGLAFPTALSFDPSGNLWVADGANSRVLMFAPPFSSGMAATTVVGQNSFTSFDYATSANRLSVPSSIAFDPFGNLWVSDTYNNRTIRFSPPFVTGMSASLVVGQASMNGISSGCAPSLSTMCFPTGIGFDRFGRLWVVDSSNNRTLCFPSQLDNGTAATIVLGQPDFTSAKGGTSASKILLQTSNGFYITGLAFDSAGNLWIGDSPNNRVLEFATNATIKTSNVITSTGDLTYPVLVGNKPFNVGLATNSTITDFAFNSQGRNINFTVSGVDGTRGYVNATWPKNMLNGTITVTLDGKQAPFKLKETGANYRLYLAYSHSQHSIVITGSAAVPEFPATFLPLVMLSILALATIVLRNSGFKRPRTC